MTKLYAALILIAIFAGTIYGSINYGRVLERAENAEDVAGLQNGLSELGLVIQKQESTAANNARKLIQSDEERVRAIKTNSGQTEEIKRLERIIKQERKKSAGTDSNQDNDTIYYRVVDVNDINRVWDEARSSRKLPESEPSSVLQGGLSAVAAPDINEAIKYCIGRYNACGIKYNSLWRASDRLNLSCNQSDLQ